MSTLLEDIKGWYEDESYPPDGPEFEAEQVSWEVIDTSGRWGNQIQVVYKRGDELVAVYDMEPATEMQDWGDYGDPEIVEVEEIQVTITKYQRKTDY